MTRQIVPDGSYQTDELKRLKLWRKFVASERKRFGVDKK